MTETPRWIDGYRILDSLAEGGMGRLFRALDTTNGRMVALKLTQAGTTAEVASLLREAAALRRLQHPGIVRLFDDGIWMGTPWLALELLEGRSLLEEMETCQSHGTRAPSTRVLVARPTPAGQRPGAPRPPDPPPAPDRRPIAGGGRLGEALGIVTEIAAILDHVHAAGLVHRDIKPDNVFLRVGSRPGAGRVTLLDFGLACRANSSGTADANSACVGTMQYAAPEQIRGEPVDGRADLYALGCVLYELVTGRRPFQGDSAHEVAQKHLHRQPVPPSDLVWGLPWQVEDLVMDMLAKRADMRPDTAGQVAQRLVAIARRRATGSRPAA